MGIDIYLKWTGQTKAEEQAQITGFSTAHGHVGYLRAAYWNNEACGIFYDLFERVKWDSGKPFKYDFGKNREKMERLVTGSEQHGQWKQSVRDFFALALTKKNPRIYVSA